ncbi:unnamed protein product [Prorocentrum cordatum]|uniref:Uncharacterized protein n=1 Tax=Prorocentrum cordatum TaxID=2364126 RepID=A0ABN9QBM1_9DINO|nr:unnamed protein product [Polarella glacialis]
MAAASLAGAGPRCRAWLLVLAACLAGQAAAADGGKSFFDVDWSDPATAAVELAWRVKIAFALSPLIAIACLFCCTTDDPEEEELRRKKKYDFSLQGAE